MASMYHRAPGQVTIGAPGRIRLPVYLTMVFLVSWAGAAPMVLASWADTSEVLAHLAKVLAPLQPLMFFGTLAVTLFVVTVNHGLGGLRDLGGGLVRVRVGLRWYGFALLFPPVLILACQYGARVLEPSLPDVRVTPDMLTTTGMIFLGYLLLNTEEIAWRGYVLPLLQGRHSRVRAHLILGVIWTLFHVPLFLFEGGHPAGYSFLWFIPMVFAISFLAGYLFNRTGGSILLAHLFHQSLNAWSEGFRIFPAMNDGDMTPFALMVAAVGGLGLLALLAMTRRR